MPYIDQSSREALDGAIDSLIVKLFDQCGPDWDGALNYTITRLVNRIGAGEGRWRYTKIARVMGCLESVKAEFYRRRVADYEDRAIERHGDLEEYQ